MLSAPPTPVPRVDASRLTYQLDLPVLQTLSALPIPVPQVAAASRLNCPSGHLALQTLSALPTTVPQVTASRLTYQLGLLAQPVPSVPQAAVFQGSAVPPTMELGPFA
jgi:hypothetical protein